MVSKLRWKVALVLAVIFVSSIWAWYPPLADRAGVSGPRFLMQKRLALGLDLKGGVQFQLRVNVDEALRAGADVTRDEIVEQAKQAVDRRINELGVVEPLIAVQGANRDELLVQLPGFADVTRARSVLGTTALLEWKLVDAGPAATREALLANGAVPPGTEIVETAPGHEEAGGEPKLYYRLHSAVEVSGRDIRRASATQDANGLPAVGFSLTPEGGRRFAELTRANTGRQLAIVLDGRVQSAPVIESAITEGQGVIQGSFTSREANDLALVLRSGALPVSMTYLGGEYVGPTLGLSSIQGGVAASVMGLVLVAAFMLVYYRRAGINAVLSVVANLAILLGALALVGAALSLPGIAGLILTIGMGVDSNVLIFERIKEELKAGRPARSAMRHGFDRVLLTILDTHVASLIAAAFLFQFGTGAIRGFATTLTLGLLANVFTAVVVSRTLFEISLSRSAGAGLGLWTGASERAGQRSFDFLSYRWYALAFSAAIVAACLAPVIARGGIPVGLDFTGGTAVVARFASPVSEDDVRRAIPGDETVQRYGPAADRALLIRLPQTPGDAARMDQEIEAGVTIVTKALGDGEASGVRDRRQPDGRRRDRRGPAEEGRARDGRVARGHQRVHRAAIPPELRRRRHRRDRARHRRDRGDARRLWLRPHVEYGRGHSDHRRLLGERHDRHLRSRAGESADRARHADRVSRESGRQSDARPHDHHGRHDVPVGAGAVPVRRRGAARLCVRDAGRDRDGHLLDGLRRGADCGAAGEEEPIRHCRHPCWGVDSSP